MMYFYIIEEYVVRPAVLLLVSGLLSLGAVFVGTNNSFYSIDNWRVGEILLRDLREGDLIVDTSPRASYDHNHISGAIWLSEEDWDAGMLSFLSNWAPGKRIVFYGQGWGARGSRGAALRLLSGMAVERIYLLEEWGSADRGLFN